MKKDEGQGFPKELLKKPAGERLEYFRGYTVAHPVLRAAYEKAQRILRFKGGKQIILIIGPGRSGKTFLCEWLEEEIRYEWAPLQATDPGRIPVVTVEVPGRDTLRPTWKLIYELILEAVGEPLIDRKVVYDDLTHHPTAAGELKLNDRLSGGKFGLAVAKALRNRRAYLFLDEFHHVLDWPGWSYQDQMHCVKSLANRGRTKLGLFATYEALDLLDLDDQTECRTKIIHLRRYGLSDEDLADFQGVVYSFQLNLPFRDEPDLMTHFDYLYERTSGRVGLLAIWLQEACHLALEEGAPTVRLKHLRQTEPLTKIQARKMLAKLIENENSFNGLVGEDSEAEEEKEADVSDAHKTRPLTDVPSADAKSPKQRGQRRMRRVGERKPERDSTGRGRVAA
jgi:hypothetical protein